MLAGCKTYLLFSKTFLTFAILLIKFLRQKTESDISGCKVYQVSYFFGAIYHLTDDNRPFQIFLSIVKSKLIVSLAFFANRF